MSGKRKVLGYIIIIFLITSNIYLLQKVNSLESMVRENRREFNNESNRIRSDINNIYENIDKQLKKQVSIFDNITVELGDLDGQSLMIPLHIEVTPKIISDRITAELIWNDKILAMTQRNTSFELDTQISVFENFQPEEVKIVVTDGEKKTTETIDNSYYYNMRERYLLHIDGGFNGQTKYRRSNGNYSREGKINVHIFSKKDNYAEYIKYVSEVNGKVIDEKAFDELKHKHYLQFDVKDSVNLASKDIFTNYLLITDYYGLVYKYVISTFRIDENGNPDKEFGDFQIRTITEISDKDGKVLWKQK
jgi:hypothetical protein